MSDGEELRKPKLLVLGGPPMIWSLIEITGVDKTWTLPSGPPFWTPFWIPFWTPFWTPLFLKIKKE